MEKIITKNKRHKEKCSLEYRGAIDNEGAKGDWDFRNSDLIKSPDGTDI